MRGGLLRQLNRLSGSRRYRRGRRRRGREVERHSNLTRDGLPVSHRGNERPLTNRDDGCFIEVGSARLKDVNSRDAPVDVDRDREHDVRMLSRRERGRGIHRVDARRDRRRRHGDVHYLSQCISPAEGVDTRECTKSCDGHDPAAAPRITPRALGARTLATHQKMLPLETRKETTGPQRAACGR